MANPNVSNASKKLKEVVEVVPCETFFRRDIWILRMTGMLSINSIVTNKVGKSTIWESIIFTFGLTQFFLLWWFISAQMVEKWRSDPHRAIDPTAGSVTCCLCIVKNLTIWINREEIQKSLHHVIISWEEANRRIGIRKEILKIAKNMHHREKLYIICVIIACLTYALRPIIFLLRHHLYEKSQNATYDYSRTVYSAKYFSPIDTMGKYTMCICWEQITVFLVGLHSLATDCIFFQLTTHAEIQFRVLQHDLKCLASSNDSHGDEQNEKILIERLSTIVEKHCDTYRHWDRIKRTFGAVVFSILFLTAAITCLCTFQLQKEISHKNWSEVFRNLFHALVLGVMSLMYCGYAHRLQEQSNLVAQAAYDSQWMDRSKELKVMLRVIMIRAQRPLNCTVYGLVSPNLTQVTLIFKAAASYFTLLESLA